MWIVAGVLDDQISIRGRHMLHTDFDNFLDELRDAGMAEVRAKELTKQLKQDMHDWPELYESLDTCSWFLKNGFLPGRSIIYGEDFNEKTYKNYSNDWEYFLAHPLNNHFAIWINDKLTLKYMLNTNELAHLMPEYYLYVENDGHYTYLMDAPSDIPRDRHFIHNLLLEKKHLALKPNRGSGGKGFIDLKFDGAIITANGDVLSEEAYLELMSQLDGYIVTEFIEQNEQLNEIFEDSDCTLRVILYKKCQSDEYAPAEYGCMLAYARFGSSRSHGASNLCHGGLAVRINWDTGLFEDGFRGNSEFWGAEGAKGFSAHPDSGRAVDGMPIPHWNEIRRGLLDVCEYLSSLDYFGMDVLITDDGFKLCEINSAPSLGLGQFHTGKCCLDTEDARKFMQSKLRNSNKDLYQCFIASLMD